YAKLTQAAETAPEVEPEPATDASRHSPTQAAFEVERRAEFIHVEKGGVLHRQGDATSALYLVLSGLLGRFARTEDGERLVGEIAAGQTVGELSVLSDDPQPESIYALRDTNLLCISRRTFNDVSRRYPEFLMAVTQLLVQRLHAPDRLTGLGTSLHTVAVVPV